MDAAVVELKMVLAGERELHEGPVELRGVRGEDYGGLSWGERNSGGWQKGLGEGFCGSVGGLGAPPKCFGGEIGCCWENGVRGDILGILRTRRVLWPMWVN